jgi:hypothetical protein
LLRRRPTSWRSALPISFIDARGAKPVSDADPRPATFLHDALERVERRGLIPLRRNHRFQNVAFVIGGTPQMSELAVDLHKDLIQVPTLLRIAAHTPYPRFPDFCCEHRAEPVPPEPDCLMADVDPALGQKILDVAQRQRVLGPPRICRIHAS